MGYLVTWTPSEYEIFVRFVLSLTVFGYRQLPVSRVMWPQKLKMAENGLAWQFSTQWVPILIRFAISLTVFKILSTSCFEGHVTSEIKNGRKWVTSSIDHPADPKFCPFRSITYRFRDIANFLFQRSHDPWKLKMAENGLPCLPWTPSGSQIFVRFALSLTIFEILSTSLFRRSHDLWN